MSRTPRCGEVDPVGLALGGLDGPERAATLAHLEQCSDCRREATRIAATVDVLLLAIPGTPPRDGFTEQVIDAVTAPASASQVDVGPSAPASSSPPLRRRLLLAAAAVVLVGAVVAGFALFRPTPSTIRTARMVDSQGVAMGTVKLAATPQTMTLALPNWYAPHGTTATYRVRVVPEQGPARRSGAIRLDAHGTWTGRLSVDPRIVTRVELTDLSGRVLCAARFG